MNDSLISIIIPMYNAEEFIKQSINSVLSQSYSNWELLIVDDCSKDRSKKIVMEYTKKYKNIHYYKHKKNLGVAEARNTGIKNANGKYIAFLDSDDIWFNKKLENQFNFMREKNLAFTYTSYEMIDGSGERLNNIVEAPKKLNYNDMLKGNSICCFTVMINKDKVKNLHMPKVRHEDYATWLNILKKGYYAYGLQEVLGYYRKGENSLTSNKFSSAKWTWNIYRKNQDLSIVKSIYYFSFYFLKSIKKHLL